MPLTRVAYRAITASNQPQRRAPAGGHADLAAGLGQVRAVLVEQFGRERAGADAGGVGLEDSQHRGDARRSDPGADGGAAGRRVRRGDERVGAVVDVEQGALRPLQQDGLALFQRLVQQQPGIGDAVLEPFGLGEQVLHHLGRLERLAVVDLDQHLVLEFQCALDLFGQQLLVEHVGDPDADAGDLVLVAGTDAATGGADLLAARISLRPPCRWRRGTASADARRREISRPEVSTPRSSRPWSSVSSTPGSTTTPLPMTLVTPGVRMPDGIRCSAKFSPWAARRYARRCCPLVANHPLHATTE